MDGISMTNSASERKRSWHTILVDCFVICRSKKNQHTKDEPVFYSQIMKPQKRQAISGSGRVSARVSSPRGTPGLNYTEITFDDSTEISWNNVVRSEPGVEYCQINPFTLPPKTQSSPKPQTRPKPSPVVLQERLSTYSKTQPKEEICDHQKTNYENVTPEIVSNKYENVNLVIPESKPDQNLPSTMNTSENPRETSNKTEISPKGSYGIRRHGAAEKAKPVPTPRVSRHHNSVTPLHVDEMPNIIKKRANTCPQPNQHQKETWKLPGLKDPKKLAEKPWLMGRMTRQESEALLLHHGKPRDFLVRESINREGDFTLCIVYDSRVRHFPIQRTDDCKFHIGKNTFEQLSDIVEHYRTHALLYDDNQSEITLGKPVIVRK